MSEACSVEECSFFRKKYKKVLKKYRNSFDDDYDKAIQVVTKKLFSLKGEYRKLTILNVIPLDETITYPILKLRIYIDQARDTTGRLVFLFDKEKNLIFLIDVYYHPDRDNHCEKTIKEGFKEYLELNTDHSEAK